MSALSLSHRRYSRDNRSTQNKRRSSTSRAKVRRIDLLEHLEQRLVLSTLTDGGTSTLFIALAPDENLAIISDGSTYQFSSNQFFSDSGVADPGDFSGFGGWNLTLQASGVTRYTTISITDASGASANCTVTFNDSAANSYASSFTIALTSVDAGAITFNGATSFAGSNALDASTSNVIVVESGASITTDSGGISLSANQQPLPTSGNFIGIDIFNGTVRSATGAITLQGTGGISGSNNYGVAIEAGGTVQTTDAAAALISITGSAVDGSSAAIAFDQGVISTVGDVSLTANGGSIIEVVANTVPDINAADGVTFTTTGTNSAIGTALLPIQTAIGALTATTNDGGVYIADSNGPGMIINSVLAREEGYDPGINGSSEIVVNGRTGTYDVSVTATGDILFASAASVATTIAAPDAVTISSTGGRILQGQPGTVNVLAQSAVLTASGALGAAGGALGLMVETFDASTTDGSIYLAEMIPGTAASVIAGGAGNNASVSGAGTTLNIGTVTALGIVTVEETGGALLSGASTNITGQTVNLTGKSGIGTTATPFTVTASNVAASVTDPGVALQVTNTTALSSASATTNNGDATVAYTGGALLFTASTGLLTASGAATVSFGNTGGNVEFGAVNAANIAASGAIIAGPGVNLTGDTVTLTAGTGIGAVGTPIQTNVTTLNATTTSGNIIISQTGAFTLNAVSAAFTDPSTHTGSNIDVTTTGEMTVGAVSALGTVALNAGGAILAGSPGTESAFNVSAAALDLTAANGIGTSGAALQTLVPALIADGGPGGGLFVSNNQDLTLTSASAAGGDVSITTIGDFRAGPVTAAGQAVTLSATGALLDTNGSVLDVTSQSATLSGSSIGSPSDPLEVEVSSLTATGSSGGVYISDLNTGTVTLTATTGGLGANIDFTGAGSIALMTATAKGNTVTLHADGSIRNGLASPGVNITAQLLTIVAPGGIGTSANPLEIDVAQIATADGGTHGVFMNDAAPVLLSASTLQAAGSGTLTFNAASITIPDLGTTPVSLAAGRSLVLRAVTGSIVFLNQANTIVTSGGATITVEAGTTSGSGGVAVLGNLSTDGGAIKVTADGNITIGLFNAGTGDVTIQSANGILLDGNGPSTVNVVAGSTTLSGNAPTARQLQLNEEFAIAAAAAATAEAASAQTLADAFDAQIPIITSQVAAWTATLAADQQTADALGRAYSEAARKLNTLNVTVQSLLLVDTAICVGVDVALAIAGPAQAIPAFGDGGACAVYAVLKIAEDVIRVGLSAAQVAAAVQSIKVDELNNAATAADTVATGDRATLNAEKLTLRAAEAADQVAKAAAGNTLLRSTAAQVVANQAIAATNQGNVIGSASDPLGIQVTGLTNVTAGPTDSYLQATGDAAINQIQATGSVTLISTGAITNGAAPNTPNILAKGLTIIAANGVGLESNPLLTRVGTLNAANTGGGDIAIDNSYGSGTTLDITGISNTGGGNVIISSTGESATGQGIIVSGPISATGAGTVTINSGSPLTIVADVTSASAITLSAAETSAPGDDLTVNAGVTIRSTGSSVTLQAGDNVNVQAGSTIQADTSLAITANHNHSLAETAGADVIVEGTLIAASALIDVDPTDPDDATFTITPSAATPITTTGGLGSNTLNLNADGLAVTIQGDQITAAAHEPVTFNNFAAVNILNPAGGGSITLDAEAGIDDAMTLAGSGPGAGTFTLNGGTPISFSGVNSFLYNGGTGNEAITVSPFATPLLQWGVAVTIDGRSGGAGTAVLTYNNASAVSDNITIQPSAPGAGELIDANAATGASVAAVTYLQTNSFVINGSSGLNGTTDNLFINGTDPANPGASGNDDVLANFQAAGDPTLPMIRIYDAGTAAVSGRSPSAAELADTAGAAANDLFNLQSFTNFSTLRIALLGGDDVLHLAGAQSGARSPLAIDYTAGMGNDNFIVDSANGPVLGAMNYDGGPGTNSMTFTGGTATSDTYTPGTQPGSGVNTLVFAGGTESVSFQNLAPIFDQVAGPLVVNATNANNAITCQEGNDPTNTPNTAWGQVSVDNLEPINFTNKTHLTIDGLAGTDSFSINNPNTPADLAGISLAGSGSADALVTNGVAATVGVDTAAKTVTGAAGAGGAVSITYDTIGALTVNAGPSSALAVSNADTFSYTPGPAPDAGTLQAGTLPISFTGLGAGKTLALTGSGSGASLVVNDPTANGTLSVAATTGNVTLPGRATVVTSSLPNLALNGLGGVATFNVTGPLPYASITLAGGGAAVANLNGDGTAMTANLGAGPASVLGGGLGSVALPGIATLNLNAGVGDVTLAGTSGPDAIAVTPTSPTSATVQVGAVAPTVHATSTGNLTVDAGAGSDSLAVNGTAGSDTVSVIGAAVTVVGLKPVHGANVESLQANGLSGGDIFNVTSSATVPISIDGGDPVGTLPGDQLNVLTSPGDTAAVYPGPTGDQGSFVVNTHQPISFVHIESLSVSGGGTPAINGTNGSDAIAIVARDDSYALGLNGIRDFTVSVNGGPNLLFVNTPSLTVKAQAGNDQIVLQAPAPNLAAWNVTVTIDGGVPSISDQLAVITPGSNQATYTPASASSGMLGVANSNGTVADVTFTSIQSFLYDGQAGGDTFTVAGTSGDNLFTLTPRAANDAGILSMDSTLPVTFQNLGSSGQAGVNGNGGADALLYKGTAANDAFVISSTAVGGQINLDARVPVVTQNISTLSLQGLSGDDTFTLVPTIATSAYTTLNLDGGATASATGNQAVLTAAGSSALSISGQTVMQGDNTVMGTSLQNINLNGADNRLTYDGVTGVTEAINVIASPTAGQGQLSIPGVALWSFTAVPIIYANGNVADNDTLKFTGTNNSDVFRINLNAQGIDADPVLRLQAASTLLTLGNYTGFNTLTVYGLESADTYNVYTGPTVSRSLYVNGSLPSGKKKLTNVMNIFYVMPRPRIIQSKATQNPTSGLVSLNYGTSSDLVQYDKIQNVTIRQQ